MRVTNNQNNSSDNNDNGNANNSHKKFQLLGIRNKEQRSAKTLTEIKQPNLKTINYDPIPLHHTTTLPCLEPF